MVDMTSRANKRFVLVTLLLAAGSLPAAAQVGTFAAVQGRAQIQRRGGWSDAAVGSGVQVGDRLRTGPGERAKLVLQDDTILDLGPSTELVIDESRTDAQSKASQAAFRLFQGRVLGRVSDAYRAPEAHFELETPNAVTTVQGTEFVVGHDVAGEVTEVVGISGEVEVVGKIGAMGGGKVRVGPGQMLRVRKGRLPGEAEKIEDSQVRLLTQGIEIFGTGRRDGLNIYHPVIAGRLITPDDVPGGSPGGTAMAQIPLGGDAPGLTPMSRHSMDVYTNTQPIEVFKVFPPGRLPTGGVRVRF
jgi:hypothetical protein